MANTPQRTIRIPDSIWSKAINKAANEETTVTTIVLTALREYVGDKKNDKA